jgi:radical SAM superfamily enzyme YgiQ (UPF0313 family)
MASHLNTVQVKDPRFLLMYSALQFAPVEMAKPDGSLSLTYIAGALRAAGYDVDILDVAVGTSEDRLEDTFLRPTLLPSGLWRCGIPLERVGEIARDYTVFGLTSIFTAHTSMVLELSRYLKQHYPDKLIIAGGVNARSLRRRFFDAGVDVIALSEAEQTVVAIAEAVRGKREFADVPGIAYRDETGREVVNPTGPVLEDLDQLPMPAWDLLPLEKYWQMSRPHGGQFPPGQRIQYGALQTSRGCPYQCVYCHISRETQGDDAGPIGRFRTKSIDRVMREVQTLKELGAEYLFFEDDSLFAKKKRAYQLFRLLPELKLKLLDVNGINICHLQKNYGGRLGIDHEFLETLAEAGFTMLTLPFESANQRLIDKYATAKWNVEKTDTHELIQACSAVGIKTAGNYMIGYPDETLEEIHNTILMCRRHVELGMNHGHFFAVVPFPGTQLFDMVIASGQLDPGFDPDDMKWTRSILKNLAVPADTLEHMRQLAWLVVNRPDFVSYKIAMRVSAKESPPRSQQPDLLAATV